MPPPNGHSGSKAAWSRIERPLIAVDAVIREFARRHGLSCSGNYHNWPERSLVWGDDVRRLIQIYLESEEQLTYRVWLCASQDRGLKRFWKQENLRVGLSPEQLKAELPALLDQAYGKVNAWQKSSLEFADEVRPTK